MVAVVGDRDVQRSAQQAGWLTAHTDDRSQHSAEDHCTRPRPSLVVRLAGSRRDRDAPDVPGGIVKPPGFRCVHWRCLWQDPTGCPWGSAILGSPCQSLSRAWPTGSCGFPCAHMWQELVCGFQHGVGWQPGPTQRLQPSRGHWIRWPGRFVQPHRHAHSGLVGISTSSTTSER